MRKNPANYAGPAQSGTFYDITDAVVGRGYEFNAQSWAYTAGLFESWAELTEKSVVMDGYELVLENYYSISQESRGNVNSVIGAYEGRYVSREALISNLRQNGIEIKERIVVGDTRLEITAEGVKVIETKGIYEQPTQLAQWTYIAHPNVTVGSVAVSNTITYGDVAYGSLDDIAAGMGATKSIANWFTGTFTYTLRGQSVTYKVGEADKNGWGTASDGSPFVVLADGTVLVPVRQTAISLSGNTAKVTWTPGPNGGSVYVDPNIVYTIDDLKNVTNTGLIQVKLDDAGGAEIAIYKGTVNEKTTLVIADNYLTDANSWITGKNAWARGKSISDLVEQFGANVNAAINGGYFGASDGLWSLGVGDGSIVGICYVKIGEKGKWGTSTKSDYAAIIFDGTAYRIDILDSEIKYDNAIKSLGRDGWILSGADKVVLVNEGTAKTDGWTENTGPQWRSMIGYTNDNAPIIAVTKNGKLTYEQSAKIMKNIGSYGAIMLDGGNSAQMYANNKTLRSSPINRVVPNAIVISNK